MLALSSYGQLPAVFDELIVSWAVGSTLGLGRQPSVATVWGVRGLDCFLVDVVRGRFEAPDLRQQIIDVHRRYRAHATLLEGTELRGALAYELRRSGMMRVILCQPRLALEALLATQVPLFEAGNIHLPADACWLGEYMRELLDFPNTRHDGQVRSTSQALSYLAVRRRPRAERGADSYGPTGRRTRASLQRERWHPEGWPEHALPINTCAKPGSRRVPAKFMPERKARGGA